MDVAAGVYDLWRRSPPGAGQHGGCQVETDIVVMRWQMGQVETSADAGDQHIAGGSVVQGVETAPPGRTGCLLQQQVVERGKEGVAAAQAQCRVRGMASMNSSIGTSN